MKSALITGVAGQDGAYLAAHLTGEGYRVIGTVPDIPLPPGFVEAYLPGVALRTVDLQDRAAMRDLLDRERPDEVYNLASISSVAASWGSPVEVTEINGVAVLALLEEIRGLRDRTGYAPRVCQASSSEIFGTPVRLPQDESHPVSPTNPYGVAEALAHHSVVNHRDAYGLHASTVILFNHESPLRPAASDYVRAMHRAVLADGPGDYVVATGEARSLGELVEVAFDAAGVPYRDDLVVTNPDFVRPTDIPEMRGAPGRAESTLGWRRELSFEKTVRAMVEVDLRRLDSGIEHHPDYLRMGGQHHG